MPLQTILTTLLYFREKKKRKFRDQDLVTLIFIIALFNIFGTEVIISRLCGEQNSWIWIFHLISFVCISIFISRHYDTNSPRTMIQKYSLMIAMICDYIYLILVAVVAIFHEYDDSEVITWYHEFATEVMDRQTVHREFLKIYRESGMPENMVANTFKGILSEHLQEMYGLEHDEFTLYYDKSYFLGELAMRTVAMKKDDETCYKLPDIRSRELDNFIRVNTRS